MASAVGVHTDLSDSGPAPRDGPCCGPPLTPSAAIEPYEHCMYAPTGTTGRMCARPIPGHRSPGRAIRNPGMWRRPSMQTGDAPPSAVLWLEVPQLCAGTAPGCLVPAVQQVQQGRSSSPAEARQQRAMRARVMARCAPSPTHKGAMPHTISSVLPRGHRMPAVWQRAQVLPEHMAP